MKKMHSPWIRVFTSAIAVACTAGIAAAGVSATGGTITEVDGDRIHTFTSSGTLSVSGSGDVEVLVVAGGGGGGGGTAAGGGAGGLVSTTLSLSSGNYTVTVGQGGAGGNQSTGQGSDGENSTFGALVTGIGGGGGGSNYVNEPDGRLGGSGGGASYGTSAGTAGLATSGQGNVGGGMGASWGPYRCGGGGGAGSVGTTSSNTQLGDGGAGLSSDIIGTTTWYAGGGGGGVYNEATGGSGGQGGGGNGGANGLAATSADPNTGGGGGGQGQNNAANAGSGGSGIVIVRYSLGDGPKFSGLGVSNVTATAAACYATVSTNLTSCMLVWDTEDKGEGGAWGSTNILSSPISAGPIGGDATDLTSETQYFYRFYGEYGATNLWSSGGTFQTALGAAQEPAFTNKVASYYSITLEWADNADTETGYVLQRSINDVDYVVVAELDEDVTTYTDRGLLTGTTYYYQLAATNDVNQSSTAFSACATNAATLAIAALWTPAYTNTALWLDAADASTILMSGSSVTNWSDKSGNGRDATQNEAAKQSTYSATGFSGGPTLVFASGDEMTAGIAPSTFSSAINVYMVLSKDSYVHNGASYPFLRLQGNTAAPFNGTWSNSSNGYWNYRYVGNGSAHTGFGRFGNFPAVDTPLLLSIGINGTTYTEMYNAVNAWSGAHGGTYGDTASDVIIGRNAGGYSISEVVIMDSILSTEARQTMEGYLAWKWGMEGNLPSGHLYEDAPPLAPPPAPPAGTVIILR